MKTATSISILNRLVARFTSLAAVLVFVTCAPIASAQRSINVSEAKVYDDRTLMIMLDQLNEQLRNINFIDRAKLAAQLGLSQGFQSRDVSRSLDVGTLPIPKLTTTRGLNSSGELTTTAESEERAAFSATRPALPELPAAPNYAPVFGENASDLLDDQVNLTYQIFNLRMILERSLSDRLWTTNGGTTYKPRLIAVIGFDVDLHPPKNAHGYAAYAEITITPLVGGNAPALVALMPQEKTYNSVALNTKSTAFGGSAVAKIITIGYSERRRGETFYLFRDTDTASLTFPPAGNESKFGWVFRPVLGRKSVSSDKRHMFAVLALPEDDSLSQTTVFPVRVTTHTYWQKYNRDNLTTTPGEELVDNYALSTSLLIPTTAKAQDALKPAIKSINWYATDDKNAVVTVAGENLFTGTSVILGSNTLETEANGLLLKSSQSLQIKTTLAALTGGDAILNGRYGSSLPLQFDDTISTVNTPEGVKINRFNFANQAGRKFATLSLTLQNRDATTGKNLTTNDLPRPESMIIAVQNTPLLQPYDVQDTYCDVPLSAGGTASKRCVVIQAIAPADLLRNETLISFKYPFRGSKWSDFRLNYDPAEVIDISRLGSSTSKKTTLVISGRGFSSTWKVQLDKTYDNANPGAMLNVVGDSLLTLEVDDTTLAGYKNLIILPAVGSAIVKAIPPAKPPAPDPTLDDTQAVPTVARDAAPAIEFKGTDLGAVTKATFDGKELPFKAGKGGKSITVFASQRVTRKLGAQHILLWANDTIIPAKIIVQ